MNKVFSFGVDEDSSFFSDEFSSVEEFFEKVGSKFSNVFLDVGEENSCLVVSSIGRNEMWKSLEWDGNGEEEFNKFEEYVRSVEKEIKGKSVVVLNYYVGCDDGWLVLDKNDYDRLLVLCGENEEMV